MIRTAATAAIGIALLAAGPAHATPGDDIYARPGELFDTADGVRLNFYCTGTGSPTVVFDSGFLDWAPAWSVVQPRIAKFTHVCSYDRAGSGFSGPASKPMTVERIASDLHDALRYGGIAGPYILVGAASGGNHIRAFADLFPQDVAGLVLLEADASDVDTPSNRRGNDAGMRGFVPNLKACRDAIAAGNATFRFPSTPGRPPQMCAQIFFRGLPESEWTPGLNAKLLDIAQHKVAMWDSDLSEAENIPAGEIWLQKHRRYLGRTPVRIVTTGNHAVHFLDKPAPPTIEHLKMEYDVAVAQSRWLGLSSDAKQIFLVKSSEYIAFDQPDAVVDAVKEVVEIGRR